MSPALSVIIPTYNRSAVLADTLETLAAQRADPEAFEVIVIDDGSPDETSAVAAGFRDRLPLRCHRQGNAGLNTGRNRGAEMARAPVLAYLDDDVLLPDDWVSQVLAAVDAEPGAAAVACRLLLRFESPPPPWLTPALHHYLTAFDVGGDARWLPPPEYPRGAAFALRRDWWERLGGFHPVLDRRGTSLLSNGEKELFLRLQAAGGRTLWWPQAWAYHRVHPDRLTPDWFRRRAHAQGVGDGLLDGGGPLPRRLLQLAREVVRAGRAVPILARGVSRGQGALHADLWLRYCAGRAAGLARPSVGAEQRGAVAA